jgi:D-beta-D-heptose 7-phosphate kinase/D-beta-D-heptose 1-phosphate adenosyltransferase
MSKSKIVCVSGGFDPLHIGHLRQIEDAKKLGDMLIVILNSDRFLINKKGYYVLPMNQRSAILGSLKWVDCVYEHKASDPKDMTVCEALLELKPDIFAKGGDRSPLDVPIPEEKVCEELGIEIIYGVGSFDKVASSSSLMEAAFKRYTEARRIQCMKM